MEAFDLRSFDSVKPFLPRKTLVVTVSKLPPGAMQGLVNGLIRQAVAPRPSFRR